jgi:hypothetical protein
MMSIASTKEVPTNGIIRVNHSQCVKMANNKAALDIKNINQYNPLDFFLTSMC